MMAVPLHVLPSFFVDMIDHGFFKNLPGLLLEKNPN